jgi:hypothetical protein
MRKHRYLRWLPFYMLFPVAAALLYLDDKGQMSDTWRAVILGATATLICVLALIWVERNPGLIESERSNAHTYRVVSYPWSVFQRSSFTSEDVGASEDESARHEETPVRHIPPLADD